MPLWLIRLHNEKTCDTPGPFLSETLALRDIQPQFGRAKQKGRPSEAVPLPFASGIANRQLAG